MIVGHGIDLQEVTRLADLVSRKTTIVTKILTPAERAVYDRLPDQRALIYLAGRWAAKEAFAKAYGTGIVAGCGFLDLEILSDDRGRPVFTQSPFSGRVHVSISHSGDFAQASVILEREAHDC